MIKGNCPVLLSVVLMGSALALQGCASGGGGAFHAQRGEVVMAALSQVGTPYAYGADAPGKALDCSALARHAHRAAGLEIPRVSTAQKAAATPVSPARVREGDLVFFRTGPGQHHVGLMVDETRFVHASTSQKEVLVSSLDQPYWRSRLIGAGTYFN